MSELSGRGENVTKRVSTKVQPEVKVGYSLVSHLKVSTVYFMFSKTEEVTSLVIRVWDHSLYFFSLSPSL